MSPRTDSDISVTADLLPGLERMPYVKGFEPGLKKTYFYAMGRLYYYDEDRNIYLDNSPSNITLARVGKPFEINNLTDFKMLEPDFYIQGIPYYFDHMSGALLYQDQTTFRTVHTWTPDLHNFEQALSTTFVPRATGNVLQPTKHEVGTPDAAANGNSPGNSFVRGPWSPGSSAQSPIVSAGSRAPSEGLEPLIRPEPRIQPGYIEGIQLWQHQTKLAQGSMQPPDKMDRRRCPQCNKVFRRPSSLDDHLDVHSGAKPHMCPFKNCRTGFATKSNMKRHFLTHRVGTLEEYSSGGTKAVRSQSRTTTYNSGALDTKRFRLAN